MYGCVVCPAGHLTTCMEEFSSVELLISRKCYLMHCCRNASYDAGRPSHDARHASGYAWNATRVRTQSLDSKLKYNVLTE